MAAGVKVAVAVAASVVETYQEEAMEAEAVDHSKVNLSGSGVTRKGAITAKAILPGVEGKCAEVSEDVCKNRPSQNAQEAVQVLEAQKDA